MLTVSNAETTERYDCGTREAGELLGVTQYTVKRWAREGRIPAIRTPGGHYRFSRTELIDSRRA